MMNERLITCAQVDERLAEWMEGELDARMRGALEEHIAGCVRCAGLVKDLESIRRDAARLPVLVPSRDLWPEIEARIQAPVISLDPLRVSRSALRRPWWMAAAAAGLVVVSASVTYYATTRVDAKPTIVMADPTIVRVPDTAQPVDEPQPAATFASETPRSSAQGGARPSGPAPTPSDVSEESEYDRDVARLRAILQERRSELDSSTVTVLERNLELIDRAIAESRAALERDPGSEFLADQLARVMTKKVAILRTAALLPSRS
jgi:hypothetical protein